MLRKELRAIVLRPKVFNPDPCCSVHSSSVQRVVFMGVLGPIRSFGPPAGRCRQ